MRSFRPAVRPAAVAGATAAAGAAAAPQGGRASILVTFVTDSAEEAVEHIRSVALKSFGLKYGAMPRKRRWLFE